MGHRTKKNWKRWRTAALAPKYVVMHENHVRVEPISDVDEISVDEGQETKVDAIHEAPVDPDSSVEEMWSEHAYEIDIDEYETPLLARAERRFKTKHSRFRSCGRRRQQVGVARKPDADWRASVEAWKTVQRQTPRPTVSRVQRRPSNKSITRHTLTSGASRVHEAIIGQVDEQESLLRFMEELQYREVTPEDFDRLLELDAANKKKTLSKNKVAQLPRWTPPRCGEGANEDCAICIGPLRSEGGAEAAVVLPCGHPFHRACISSWLLEHADHCPIDRLPL